MNIGEKWKKTILNRWLVYKKKDEKHYFLLTSLYPMAETDWVGKVTGYSNQYNGYYAMKTSGSALFFKCIGNLPANLEIWGRCSYLSDAKILKMLSKKVTKSLLNDEKWESNTALFNKIFDVGEHDEYRF